MSIAKKLLEEGAGIYRLAPTWVPRAFCRPAKRIKLHPDDEGLSYIVSADGSERVLLRDAVSELKGEVIGENLWNKYHKWPMFSKFFDNLGPLPHHIHHRDEHAKRGGEEGKPEMYFFPSQCNNYEGEFGHTYFGLRPETTKEEVKEALMNFSKGDNKLLDLSQCYKITLDTGWDVPPGVLHAPASMCTYEPQFASDSAKTAL